MRYHNITKDDMLNGDGLRVVLWTSGCSHKCEGCQNPITWDPECGLIFDDDAKNEIFEQLNQSYCSGITFSGGDPMHDANVDTILALAKEIKDKYPTKTIWLYTGYTYEAIQNGENSSRKELIKLCDVIVDGPFVLKDRDVTLMWKGSPNQRVIDVQKTLEIGNVVLHCPDKM